MSVDGLCSMSREELETLIVSFGEPKFRAKQVFSWLSRGARPAEMTNLPKALREKLETLTFGSAVLYDKRISAKDGTVKYLFALEDQNLVEGVLMRYRYGNTLCISTQVGCKMGCAFCASTLEGCVRNLTAGEMLGFLSVVERHEGHDKEHERAITNVVLMGSGEPLDNYGNVVKFLRLVSDKNGMNVSPRNISLSTCGLVPEIYRFMEEAPHVTLSVSLHAPNDSIRDRIMPINRRYPMEQLLQAANAYAEKTGRRVVFEYALIGGLNDAREHADELSDRLRGINCHVNLIPLNPVLERGLNGVTREHAQVFAAWLMNRGISATVRREMGTDIEGACGQLRRRALKSITEAQERDEGGTDA
ncbi:MAG TPA: 23S rRNA (adenine(2503)-C(2))-methyltransferase RlmN [Clostridia bacterium]|nr:23S rRNA (adenine(2503)-C(2))-methyltransferase RlmN [Clostridia bacterium]